MSIIFVLCVSLLGTPSLARPPTVPGAVVKVLPAPGLAAPAVGQRGEVTVAFFALGRRGAGAVPVIYLPGFDAGPGEVRKQVLPALVAAVKDGRLPPLSLAVVDGRNALGGGLYAGAWEDWLAQALPAQFEEAGHAGKPLLVGHSMGARGALKLAAAHPGRFAGVVAVSPLTGLASVASPAVMARAAQGLAQGEGPAKWVAHPTASRFRERLLWAAVAAWAPPTAGWAAALDGESLNGAVQEALAAQLEPDRAFARVADGFCELPLLLSVGRGDGLVTESAVQALGAALHGSCPSSRVRLTVHGGDHLSHLAEDVVAGLGAHLLQ